MKEIKLMLGGTIEVGAEIPVNIGIAIENFQIAQKNGGKIMGATLSLERELEQIILRYFFTNENEKMKTFNNLLLSTEWFSLNAKCKFIIALVNKESFLDGKDKDDFSKYIKKIISLRNAFAHGSITEKSSGTYIVYFEGQSKEKELNDSYWSGVEDTFEKIRELIKKIEEKLTKRLNVK